MSTYVRNITISANDLGAKATLLLVFDNQPMPGIYRDYFPVAWKAITFGAVGPYRASVAYQSQLALLELEVESGRVINVKSWKDINLQQQNDNTTQTSQYSGLGFHTNDGGSVPSTALVFEGSGPAQKEFTPILRVYVTTSYQENEILRGQVMSPVILELNLPTVSERTYWTLNYDDATGRYSIRED